MLDEVHGALPVKLCDSNLYHYGAINGHNIIIVCIPPGLPGSVSASNIAYPLQQAFKNLKVHLFVGIGGGVPHQPPELEPNHNIHLGDVVVGWSEATNHPAVVQYDLKIQEHGEYKSKLLGTLDKPNRLLIGALGAMLSNREIGNIHTGFQRHLTRLKCYPQFSHPGLALDKLYRPDYLDIGKSDCSRCDISQLIKQNPKLTEDPIFHQRTILSGNSIIKDTRLRDKLSKQFYIALYFKIETAGVINKIHCLIIRGISDYSDSHKPEEKNSEGSWQRYAAATAAAFAREFLYVIPYKIIKSMKSIQVPNQYLYTQQGNYTLAQPRGNAIGLAYNQVHPVRKETSKDFCTTTADLTID